MLLDLYSALRRRAAAEEIAYTGELFPIRLDGSKRLADLLRDGRTKQRRRDESLLLLGME